MFRGAYAYIHLLRPSCPFMAIFNPFAFINAHNGLAAITHIAARHVPVEKVKLSRNGKNAY